MKLNNVQGSTAAATSSAGMFSKPNFSPGHSPTAGAAMNNQFGHRVSGIGTGGGDIGGHG